MRGVYSLAVQFADTMVHSSASCTLLEKFGWLLQCGETTYHKWRGTLLTQNMTNHELLSGAILTRAGDHMARREPPPGSA